MAGSRWLMRLFRKEEKAQLASLANATSVIESSVDGNAIEIITHVHDHTESIETKTDTCNITIGECHAMLVEIQATLGSLNVNVDLTPVLNAIAAIAATQAAHTATLAQHTSLLAAINGKCNSIISKQDLMGATVDHIQSDTTEILGILHP